jgi:hypothetical protein
MHEDDRFTPEPGHPMRLRRVKRGESPLDEDALAELGWDAQRRLFPA